MKVVLTESELRKLIKEVFCEEVMSQKEVQSLLYGLDDFMSDDEEAHDIIEDAYYKTRTTRYHEADREVGIMSDYYDIDNYKLTPESMEKLYALFIKGEIEYSDTIHSEADVTPELKAIIMDKMEDFGYREMEKIAEEEEEELLNWEPDWDSMPGGHDYY